MSVNRLRPELPLTTLLEKELDKHDDDITTLSVRLQTLLTPTKTTVTPTTDSRKLLSRKLTCLEAGLSRTNDNISATPIEPSLFKQCQEQLSDYKKDLSVLYDDLLAMDVADEDELLVLPGAFLESQVEGCSRACSRYEWVWSC